MKYPEVISQLINAASAGRWAPIYFELNEADSTLREVRIDDPNRGPILRIECWVETANQYVFTERFSKDDSWSPVYLGEIFNQEEVIIETLEQIAEAILFCSQPEDIHPAIRRIKNESQFN